MSSVRGKMGSGQMNNSPMGEDPNSARKLICSAGWYLLLERIQAHPVDGTWRLEKKGPFACPNCLSAGVECG